VKKIVFFFCLWNYFALAGKLLWAGLGLQVVARFKGGGKK